MRDGELQPPRPVLAVEPARQPRLPHRRYAADRSDRRGLQPLQRQESGAPGYAVADTAGAVHAAHRLRRRRRPARTARGTDRVQNYVLTRSELLPLLRLAGPVVLAEIGWMGMGIVDTMMVGPLGPAAIGATGLGSAVFTAIAIFVMGLMLGLDALVSQAYGAGDRDDCTRWLHHGVLLALVTAPLVMTLTWLAYLTLDSWGLHPDILALVKPYLSVIAVGAWPMLLYAAFRRYLQGMHIVRPIMYALISANLINAGANWLLIYGNLGFPALDVAGSAWATTAARVYMAAFLFVAIRGEHKRRADRRVRLAIEPARFRRLIALGSPAAATITLEVGVFAAATALAGKLDPVSAGAHQIALNLASLAFMVPLGLASSGAVRVGHAFGARDPHRAARAGWAALATSSAIMLAIGLVFFIWPVP